MEFNPIFQKIYVFKDFHPGRCFAGWREQGGSSIYCEQIQVFNIFQYILNKNIFFNIFQSILNKHKFSEFRSLGINVFLCVL